MVCVRNHARFLNILLINISHLHIPSRHGPRQLHLQWDSGNKWSRRFDHQLLTAPLPFEGSSSEHWKSSTFNEMTDQHPIVSLLWILPLKFKIISSFSCIRFILKDWGRELKAATRFMFIYPHLIICSNPGHLCVRQDGRMDDSLLSFSLFIREPTQRMGWDSWLFNLAWSLLFMPREPFRS